MFVVSLCCVVTSRYSPITILPLKIWILKDWKFEKIKWNIKLGEEIHLDLNKLQKFFTHTKKEKRKKEGKRCYLRRTLRCTSPILWESYVKLAKYFCEDHNIFQPDQILVRNFLMEQLVLNLFKEGNYVKEHLSYP